MVIKYGGNAMISEELRSAVISDIILLNLVGVRVVMVHGGGPEIGQMLERGGEAVPLCGRPALHRRGDHGHCPAGPLRQGEQASGLHHQQPGGKAIGLCGLDGALFQAKKLDEKYGLVGKIVKVCPQVVNDVLASGYIPVISTVALGIDNDTAYNINADTAPPRRPPGGGGKAPPAPRRAGRAQDPKDESTLIRQIRLEEVPPSCPAALLAGA